MQTSVYDYQQLAEDYSRVERAILFLEENFKQQPNLEEVSRSVHLSEYHFQRLFTRWVGISPKRFLQFLTKEYAKKLLERSESLLDVAYQTGLSGSSRLYDLFITCEAVTPGEFKSMGEGLSIHYGFHPSPFGECMLAVTDRGICGLVFVRDENRDQALNELKGRWMKAQLIQDQGLTAPYICQIFPLVFQENPLPLNLFLNGSNFQIKVWEALLSIPPGWVVSYEDIAVQIGLPNGVRVVSKAIANNPIPVIIPCHRVIRKTGEFGGYRWGTTRKKALLGWEQARSSI